MGSRRSVHAGLPQIEPPPICCWEFGVETRIGGSGWNATRFSPARWGCAAGVDCEVSSAARIGGLERDPSGERFRRASSRLHRAAANHVAKAPTRRVPFLIRRTSAPGTRGTRWEPCSRMGCLLPAMVEKRSDNSPRTRWRSCQKLRILMRRLGSGVWTVTLCWMQRGPGAGTLAHLRQPPREALVTTSP